MMHMLVQAQRGRRQNDRMIGEPERLPIRTGRWGRGSVAEREQKRHRHCPKRGQHRDKRSVAARLRQCRPRRPVRRLALAAVGAAPKACLLVDGGRGQSITTGSRACDGTVFRRRWLERYFGQDPRWTIVETRASSDFLDDAVMWFDYAAKTSPSFQLRGLAAVLQEVFRSEHGRPLTEHLLASSLGTELIMSLRKQV